MKAYNRKGEKPLLKKFKKVTKYPHHRSDGLTHRTNRGSQLQPSG